MHIWHKRVGYDTQIHIRSPRTPGIIHTQLYSTSLSWGVTVLLYNTHKTEGYCTVYNCTDLDRFPLDILDLCIAVHLLILELAKNNFTLTLNFYQYLIV